jgi:riboflavin transporter
MDLKQNQEGIIMKNISKSTNLMVKISLLSAIAAVFMYFDFPVLPAFPWLKIDLSDVPALIGAFAYGPIAGVIIEGFKIFLRFLAKGTQTGGVGELANFIIGASFVVPAGLIYRRNKTRKNAIVSMVAATVVMSVVGVFANLFIMVPLYSNFMPALKESSYVTNYMLYGVLPFNLIKGVLVSVVTLLIYKRVSVIILRESAFNNAEKFPKKTA